MYNLSSDNIANNTQFPWVSSGYSSLDFNHSWTIVEDRESYGDFREALVAYFTLRGVQAVMAIVGNSLTIIAVVKYSLLQNSTNIFIFSLAVSDVICGTLLYPLELTAYLTRTYTTEWYDLCKVKEYFLSIIFHANIFSTFLIGIERFIYLHFPLRYPFLMDERRAVTIISVLWMSLLIFCALHVFLLSHDAPPVLCDYKYMFPPATSAIVFIYSYGVISGLTGIVYMKIGHLAVKKARTPCTPTTHRSTMCRCYMSKIQFKVTKMIAMVLGLYFVFYFPIAIITPLVPVRNPPRYLVVIRYILASLWYGTSWCNPFIYAWHNDSFRTTFKSMLTCRHGHQVAYVPE